MLNGLDLFSGIGGLTLALKPWVETVAYCENDRYAQSVLLQRMWSGDLDEAPIWDDVRTLRGEHLEIPIDIIYGGFPCQDISAAGAGRGLVGERSGLYWHIERIVRETNPRFVFLENVPAIRTRGLNAVVQSFTELGYDCRWTIVSAAEVGAPHIRKRWFLLAHANGLRLREKQWPQFKRSNEESRPLVNHGEGQTRQSPRASSGKVTPRVGRAGDDVPDRMDRHRALGNAVVPLQAREAFMRLIGITPTPEADE